MYAGSSTATTGQRCFDPTAHKLSPSLLYDDEDVDSSSLEACTLKGIFGHRIHRLSESVPPNISPPISRRCCEASNVES